MLNSLEIKNYRNLKKLRISSLARVNLITGKNNTGKSTILEAIAIYATKGDLNFIYQLLGERGENYRLTEANKNSTDLNIRALSSLFTNRLVSFEISDAISIGSIESNLFGESQSSEKSVSLRFVKYFDEIQRDNQGVTITRKRTLLQSDSDKQFANFKVGLEIRAGGDSYILSLDEDRPYRFGFKGLGNNESFQFIRTRNIDKEINGKLFDNITLTQKEQYVIDALKIIEPSSERIAFIEETPRGERAAVIKLSNNQGVLPLRSMGDGINRVLTIILALVNSDNGFLFIDEFENGLHYVVQEQLWNIIFNLAQKLNIQIFVTTHSEDCISGFENILNSSDNTLDGKLIRLDNEKGIIKLVEFNANELKIANDQNIETR
jgi:AAA15 family ATPase/GTPase